MNTNEILPEYFYIFTNRYNRSLINQIENHNIALRKGILMSSGFSNVICNLAEKRESFLNGDMDYLPFVKGNPTTIGLNSPFMNRITERYTLEYNLEVYRKFYLKTYPSRFSGIFAFGSYEDCEKMALKNGWDIKNVKKYRLQDLGELNKYIKIIKTNFKVIGLLENLGITGVVTEDFPKLYEHYWTGKGKITTCEIRYVDNVILPSNKCGVLYEYLIESILEEVSIESN